MIPVRELRISLEKSAGIGDAFARGFRKEVPKRKSGIVSGLLKFIYRHPIATIGAGLATAGTLSLANKLHPLHQMFREETKNVILKDQNKILLDILNQGKKKPTKSTGQKLVVPPLT